MTTIYRKYRPQTFADLVGQDVIVQTITNEIINNRLAQAYLFSGPRGVGKTTLARLLAKAVNCLDRKTDSFEPCEQCSSCQEITAGRNVDVIEIDAASQTGVDNVRENIIENAQFKPTKSKYKVFIIDEVHMLSTSSFNALLKTLEEPPAHVIFILATTELHKLPATVISRCQKFNFHKISFEVMLSRLEKITEQEKIKVDKHVLNRLAAKSDGCLRDAESLLGQILSLNLKKITEEDTAMILPVSDTDATLGYLEFLFNQDAAGAVELISRLAAEGGNLEQFTLGLIEVLRSLLIAQATRQTELLKTDYSNEALKKIKKLSTSLSPASLVKLIDFTLERKQQLKTAPLPQLPLELLAVEFISLEQNNSSVLPLATVEVAEPAVKSTAPEHSATIGSSIKAAFSTITGHVAAPKTTLAELQAKWPELIGKLSESNHALIFILKMCTIKEITDAGIRLAVPYSIHKDKLEENKTRKLIETALTEVYGEKINFQCEIEPAPAPAVPASETELISLAADFGGEIVG